MDAAPVIGRGHNVAAFTPPVTEGALPYLQSLKDRRTLVLTPDADRATALGAALQQGDAVVVSGLARAAHKLAKSTPALVLASAADALALVQRSALPVAAFEAVVIAWPEQLDEAGFAALEALMGETAKEAQRLILSAAPGPDLDQLIERYAFKALTFGFRSPEGGPAPAALGPARFVVARPSQYQAVREKILDALAPETDDALVIAPCPGSPEEAAALASRAAPGQPPVLVLEAHQLPWVRALFSPLHALRLPTALDALEQRAEAIRARVARTIETESLDRELFLVGPLLERFDPAEVAAAALRLAGHPAQPVTPAPEGIPGSLWAPAPVPPAEGLATARTGFPLPLWAKLWVSAGRRDNVGPGDLVGAIANQARIPADQIGKIEVKDLFSLVEVRAEHAEQVLAALTGTTLRGRRLTARVDRGPGASRPPRRV